MIARVTRAIYSYKKQLVLISTLSVLLYCAYSPQMSSQCDKRDKQKNILSDYNLQGFTVHYYLRAAHRTTMHSYWPWILLTGTPATDQMTSHFIHYRNSHNWPMAMLGWSQRSKVGGTWPNLAYHIECVVGELCLEYTVFSSCYYRRLRQNSLSPASWSWQQ